MLARNGKTPTEIGKIEIEIEKAVKGKIDYSKAQMQTIPKTK